SWIVRLRQTQKATIAMDDIAVARAIHVFAVVVWIGGVAMVTTVILPIVRRGEKERLALLEAVEGRFIWQARIASLLVAASGFYMVSRLGLWDRFRTIEFWWMHAMVLLWMIFTLILFIGEPLMKLRRRAHHAQAGPDARLVRMQWLHWALLMLSSITILAAVAGSQGMSLVP
ncbi:MAG: hypothetical protein WA728_04325, partial [Xanthobacteraceae bacterium]